MVTFDTHGSRNYISVAHIPFQVVYFLKLNYAIRVSERANREPEPFPIGSYVYARTSFTGRKLKSPLRKSGSIDMPVLSFCFPCQTVNFSSSDKKPLVLRYPLLPTKKLMPRSSCLKPFLYFTDIVSYKSMCFFFV